MLLTIVIQIRYLKKSNILKLNDLFDHESGLFMHNYVTNKLPESFGNMFTFNYEIQERHQTRQSSLLYLKRCNSKFAKKNCRCMIFQIDGTNGTKDLKISIHKDQYKNK